MQDLVQAIQNAEVFLISRNSSAAKQELYNARVAIGEILTELESEGLSQPTIREQRQRREDRFLYVVISSSLLLIVSLLYMLGSCF